jgi:hypothetical protein
MSEKFFKTRTEHYHGYEIHMPAQYYGETLSSYASIYNPEGKFVAEAWGHSPEQIRKMYKAYIDEKLKSKTKHTERFLK